MNLAELQREAHVIAKEKGWWDEDKPRTFGDCIALVHSELSEALEWYREWDSVRPMKEESPQYGLDDPEHGKYKPVGVPSELADVVIRVADMADWEGVELQSEIETLRRENDERDMTGRTFGDWISDLHASLSFSYASREWDGYAANGFPSWEELLADCVAGVQRMAAHYGIDLEAAIEAKMAYNRTRPYRHGGKAL